MTTTDLLQSDGSVDLGHFRLTPTGLEVRGAPAFPEWEKVGAFLRLAEGAVQWAIGDWWVYGGHRYGERATLAIDPTHGVDRLQRFMNYGWVARAFETSRRREVLSWSHHEAVAALDGADQDRLLDETISADWSVRDLRKAVFRLKREEATRTAGPLPPGRFDVILVDPPWDHGMVVHCLQIEGRHYPVMSQDAVCALRVGDLAADDCVLFLWAVSPMLPEAFSVLTSWGFTYKTNLAWVKDRVGLGWWVRQQHELLLIATRGTPCVPLEADRPPSVICAPRRGHSEKPDEAYGVIERICPSARKLELFARLPRDGWASWGSHLLDDAVGPERMDY